MAFNLVFLCLVNFTLLEAIYFLRLGNQARLEAHYLLATLRRLTTTL
jgi:hypothetical protein